MNLQWERSRWKTSDKISEDSHVKSKTSNNFNFIKFRDLSSNSIKFRHVAVSGDTKNFLGRRRSENYGNKVQPRKILYSNHLSRTFEDFILWEKLNLEGKYWEAGLEWKGSWWKGEVFDWCLLWKENCKIDKIIWKTNELDLVT